MIKGRSIARGAIAILMAMGFMIVWTQNRFTPSVESNADSAKLVMLKFTFADGQWARVSQFEGGTIKIEEGANTLAFTPYIRDKDSTVELKVFRIVRRGGDETMQAVESLVVGNSPVRLDAGGMSLSVQIREAGGMMPTSQVTRQCCTRDCTGRLICGVCVCTPCGVCAAYNWCDCPAPGPIE